MDVELKHLRAFVAVAEELNFTQAAKRLHLAQQALSAQIRRLEERIDVQLLERTTRKVELTDAGRVLLEEARVVLEAADRAVAATKATGRATTVLTVGLVVPADYEPLVPAIERFREQHPDVDVRVHFGDVADPAAGLREGMADVGVVVGAFDHAGLETVTLWSDPRGAAMATAHALAAHDELTIEQLVAEPTFDFVTADPIFRDFWMAINHRGGRPPHIVAQFRGLDGLVEGIRSGLGINLVRERVLGGAGPESGVVYRPVAGLEGADVGVAWRTGDTRPVVQDFVAVARETFAAARA